MRRDGPDDITVVAEAADGKQAIEQAQMHKPDVILMDIQMPHVDCLEATKQLMISSHDLGRVLVLTTFDLDEYVYEAMKAGASGFMLKDVPRRQLIEAVRTVAEGEAPLAPAVTRRLIEEFVQRPPPTTGTPQRLARLTERELDVIRLVGRGMSNAEIATKLHLGQNTVKTPLRIYSPSSISATGPKRSSWRTRLASYGPASSPDPVSPRRGAPSLLGCA
jgi:DNA-binding NarL/FixJ family response regulator